MYTFIIFGLIGLFSGLFLMNKLKDKYTEKMEFYFYALIGVLISIIPALIISCLIPIETKIEKSIFEIESLQDNNSIKGRFFLGSGLINSKMVYTLYLKNGDGFKLYQLDSEIVTIKYSDSKPSLELYEEVKTENWLNQFSIKNHLDFYYIIKVPKGTICNNFNLDAQ